MALRFLLVLAVAIRNEGEPAPVGRPAGRAVVPLAGGELPRLGGAVERGHPDRRAVGVRLLVDPAHGVRDAPAVRRKTQVDDARKRVDVLGLHSSHRGATLVRGVGCPCQATPILCGRGRGETGRRGGFRSRWAARPLEVRVLSPAWEGPGERCSSQGCDGRREARTQGAFVAAGYGRDRGRSSRRSRPTSEARSRVVQRGPAAQPLFR